MSEFNPEMPPQKKSLEGKENNESLISQATSFEDLVARIETNDISIQGSQDLFTPELLKEVISKVQSREWPLTAATSRDGFRNKVAELLDNESDIDTLRQIREDVQNNLMKGNELRRPENHPHSIRQGELRDWRARLTRDIFIMEKENSKE